MILRSLVKFQESECEFGKANDSKGLSIYLGISLKTVYTTKELEDAVKAGEKKILLKGEVAEKIRKRKKRKKGAIIGGAALAIGGLIALPFTGGASAAGIIGGLGLTIGSVTITAGELAILVGGSLAAYGIHKGYDIKFNGDGSVEITTKE